MFCNCFVFQLVQNTSKVVNELLGYKLISVRLNKYFLQNNIVAPQFFKLFICGVMTIPDLKKEKN